MSILFESPAFHGFCEQALAVLADSAAKGAILLALAWLIALGLHRSSAAARHLVWALALGGLLLLPALSLVLPKWQLPILPRTSLLAMPTSEMATPPSSIGLPASPIEASVARINEPTQPVMPPDDKQTPKTTPPQFMAQPLPFGFWLIAVWLLVAMMALVPLFVGTVFVGRLIRCAMPLEDEPWPMLVRSLSERLGLRRRVRVLRTNRSTMPMAVGVWRPTVLLPEEAEAWSAEKRRAVLLHELAHIRRWDCLTHILTRLACVTHWFNPLAWLALKKLQNERERACDDLVITSGARPAAYAEEILDIARTMCAGVAASTAAIPMARKSQLEGRLLAILDATHNRAGITTRRLALAGILLGVVLLGFGSIRLSVMAADKPQNGSKAASSQTSSSPLRGTIITPDGKPAEGAEVVLCEPGSRGFSLFEFVGNKDAKRSEQYRSSAQIITTQADGKYEFKTHAQCFGVVVRHASGVAIENEETLPQDGKVRVHPWGRVEGVLKEGNKIIPNHELQIGFDTPRKKPMTSGSINVFPHIRYIYTATTDDQGRFVFNRIHSGSARIGAQVDLGGGRSTFSPMLSIEIKPQGTTIYQLGGMGRQVTSKVVLQAGSDPAYNLTDCEVRLQPFMPRPPEAVIKAGREAYEKWRAEWEQTAEGKAHNAMKGYYRRVNPDKDGRFTINDVPAGKYSLDVIAYEMRDLKLPSGSSRGPLRIPGEALGMTLKEFEIPPMQGGRSDEPLDLGTLEVLAAKIPKAGEEAPDFKCVTLDGKELSLKDYRGKFVLLDFWATWCGPCREETPTLKALWQQYGKQPNFAMVSLSLDNDMTEPGKYVKENGMDWVQGYLGKLAENKVTRQYGVEGIPAIILIGPDGRIIERNLRGAQIGAAVGRALAASAPKPTSVKVTSSTQVVQVQVVDEAGQPVAGAVVTPNGLRMKTDMGSHMGWVPSRYGQPIPAKTDAQGMAWVSYPRYANEKLETGAITFKVTHPEYCPVDESSYPVDGSAQPVILPKGVTLNVSGRINGGKIQKDLYPEVPGLAQDVWQRQPDGSFATHRLMPGPHYLRLVYFPEQGPGPVCFSEAVRVRAEKGQAYTYDLELKPGVRLEGRLDASVPRPVKNGSVMVNAYPADMDDETRYVTPDSPGDLTWNSRQPVEPDGTFVFASLPPGKVEIIASCDGYVSKSPEGEEWKGSFAYPQRFKLDGPVQQVALAMEPAAAAEVTVSDDQGKPLPGARVSFSPNVQWLRRGAGIFMTSQITEDFLRRPDEAKRRWQSEPCPFEATTDKNGIATVRNLPPREGQTYNVTHPGFAMPMRTVFGNVKRRNENVDLAPGQTARINVKMEKEGAQMLTGARARPPKELAIPQAEKPVAAQPAPSMASDPNDPNVSPAERKARQRELIMRRIGNRVEQ